MTFSKLAAAAALGLAALGGRAEAQVISTTRDYTVTWSGSTFADASFLDAGSWAFGPEPFSDVPWSIGPYSNAENLAYTTSGGITVSPSTAPPPPYPSTITQLLSNSGAAGSFGWTYNSAAGTTHLFTGRLGNLATLNFDIGGSDSGGGTEGYYLFAYLPGDWTTEGTGTGDYIFHSIASEFPTPTFTYNSSTNTTTVEAYDPSFVANGTGADLRFTLVGSAVPEPSTWAMMLVGFTGLGFAGYRNVRRKIAIAA
jgi:hypothetical protein